MTGFTPEFNDFVSKLLQKDPVYRMNWDELKSHPWWEAKAPQPNETYKQINYKYNFTKRIYHPQLHFDQYLLNVR